jgi:hypothetical protein
MALEWKKECSYCKKQSIFYEERNDVMARIYNHLIASGGNIEELVKETVLLLQKTLLNSNHVHFNYYKNHQGVGALCSLLECLGKHFLSCWSPSEYVPRSSSRRIDYTPILMAHFPTFPAELIHIIACYLSRDFLFLIGEKIDYPSIKQKFGTKQNPHPNVAQLLNQGDSSKKDVFIGVPRQLYVPKAAQCQLDVTTDGSWHSIFGCPGQVNRYVPICQSCLLQQREIGTLNEFNEIVNRRKTTEFKVLTNRDVFVPDENVSLLLTTWMLGTDTNTLKDANVKLLPILCGFRPECYQEGVELMLKRLNQCLSIKGVL